MTKRKWVTGALLAAGVLGVGGLIAASPAMAGAGPFANQATAVASPSPSGSQGACGGCAARAGQQGNGPANGAGQRGNGPANGAGQRGNGPANGAGCQGNGAGWQSNGNGAGWQSNGSGNGAGVGRGRGQGPGAGRGDGTCLAMTAPKGTLSDAQRSRVVAMAQEEKLAHDLYQAFADKYPSAVFDRIATAEARHLEAVRNLLKRYELTDPTAGKAAGEFSDATVQATYRRLLGQGSSEQAAFKVGVTVEQDDIDELGTAGEGLTAQDVKQVYQHLLTASRQHLKVFQNWAER